MVDQSIRSVPRPKNTVVVDTGHKGSRQYAVRERAGYSFTANNNVGPRNGKVIGYIHQGKYFPKSVDITSSHQNVNTMRQYGAAALIHKECQDIYEDLLKLFTLEEANRLMTIASLRVTNPGIASNRYNRKASESFISILYPCRGLTSNSISTFLTKLGDGRERLVDFYSLRMSRVMNDHNLIIDGVLKQDTGDNTLSMPSAKTHLKGHKEISVIYAYDQQINEVVCSKVYSGNMLDAKAFRDFVVTNKVTKGIIVCDKGFPIKNIKDVLDANPDLHYISPLKRNDALIKKHSMLECDRVSISLKGKLVMYKKCKLENGQVLYTIRDCERSDNEKLAILHKALSKDSVIDAKDFNDSLSKHGTITFISDLDLDPIDILNHYDNRWLLETVFDHFKNTLDLDITRVQSKSAVIGNEFVNFIATMMTCKIVNAFKRLENKYGKKPWSIRACLEDLRDIDRNINAPFRGDVNDGFWNITARNDAFRLLVELDLADDITNTVARKRIDDISCSSNKDSKSETKSIEKKSRGRPKGSKNKKTIEFEIQFVGPPAPKRVPGRPKGRKNNKTLEFEASFVGPIPDILRLPKRKLGRPFGSKNKINQKLTE